MNTPSLYPTYVVRGSLPAAKAAQWLITDASRIFKVEPLPDDEYEFTIHFDNTHESAAFEALLNGDLQPEGAQSIPLMFLDADQVQAITGILPDEGQLYLIRDMLAEDYQNQLFESSLKELILQVSYKEFPDSDEEADDETA